MELKSSFRSYFPELTESQWEKLWMLRALVIEENQKLNLISRKEQEFVFERHILHSLVLWKDSPFPAGARVVDIGTGGGFPALPLAIVMPETVFVALDSIGKKTQAVHRMSEALELTNIEVEWMRAEKYNGFADAAVSRAVAPCAELMTWSLAWLKPIEGDAAKWQGLRALKGGDLIQEMKDAQGAFKELECRQTPIANFFTEDFFETKKIIQLWRKKGRRKN